MNRAAHNLLPALLAVATLTSSVASARDATFRSKHFTVHQLADGVFAAVHRDEGTAISNAGIIDLGGKTVVFDAFMTREAARDLLRAAKKLTGRPADFLVLSHYHNDHIWGSHVFPASTLVIATAATRMAFDDKVVAELAWGKTGAAKAQRAARVAAAEEPDPVRKHEHELMVIYHGAVAREAPHVRPRRPDITVDSKLVLHGTQRSVEIVSYGPGHTSGDLILVVPDAKVAFLGDLFFNEMHPYLGSADVDGWKQSLQAIAALDLNQLVPGHGPVGDRERLALMAGYLDQLDAEAQRLVQEGKSEEEAAARPLPEAFRTWRFSDHFGQSNRRLLYRRHAERKSPAGDREEATGTSQPRTR